MAHFTPDERLQVLPPSAVIPQWRGIPSLPAVQQLNEQCVELVCALANGPCRLAPPFVLQNNLWRHLQAEARKRVAELPFVIVDLHFTDAEWYRRVSLNPMAQCSSPGSFSEDLSPILIENLTLETLMFARQAACEDIQTAKVMFGMTDAVARTIAALTMQQVRAIATANAAHLQVRWHHDVQVWRELLTASIDADEPALVALRHRAKRLFCGDVIRRAHTPPGT